MADDNSSAKPQNGQADAPLASDKQVLYRGKGIVLFRVLVRLKVFQLLGVAGISVVATTLLSGGPVATLQMGVLTALVAGCGIASASLWYFSRRYLGEISLSPSHPGKAKFSVLDFWGHREDVLVPFEDIVPTLGALSPAAAAEMAQQPLIPIRVTSDDRQYLLSWRHGHLLQRDTLRDLLEGRLAQQRKEQAP